MADNWRLSDPEYTDFEPATVQQAILRFRRMQRKGLNPWRYPECFIKCAAKLPPAEVEKFEAWVINPAGEPDAVQAYAEADEKWQGAGLTQPMRVRASSQDSKPADPVKSP
jgi:hypothetical protein